MLWDILFLLLLLLTDCEVAQSRSLCVCENLDINLAIQPHHYHEKKFET